jgi:hypothetical protein
MKLVAKRASLGYILQKISAHALVLAIASPVFEFALQNGTNFRISNISGVEFRHILRYDLDLVIQSIEFHERRCYH